MPNLRRRREVREAIVAWNDAAPESRIDIFTRRCAHDPRAAANWYLLGCAQVRRGDVAAGARYFGKAYHADWRLESAALMTFACLKASVGEGGADSLRHHMVVTWGEMGRPALGRNAGERRILEALGAYVRNEDSNDRDQADALAMAMLGL